MNQRGFIYMTALGIALLLTTAGAALLVRGLTETGVSERSRNLTGAFHLAEAAVDQALIDLRTTPPGNTLSGTMVVGTYAIDAMVPLSPQTQQVTVHGISSGERRNLEVVIQQIPKSVFQFALFGDQTVSVGGSATTDSYDSRNGAYDPSANHEHHGDVGTNAIAAGGIALSGSLFVDGQLVVGPNVPNPVTVVAGYNPAFVTGGTSPPSDTQDVVAESSPFPMPAVTLPPGLTCNDYTVGGNTTVSLLPGVYCYHDLTIQGGGKLVPSGQVTIYLTGQMIARGNSSVGSPTDPTKMIVQMAAGGGAVLEQGTISGSTEFYGALYGPNASINITGDAKVFGSIVAKTINLTGSADIHYDKALGASGSVSNSFQTKVIEWRTLN